MATKAKVTQTWTIGARNPAFGEEGVREYRGTELGAKRAAAQIVRKAGYNWSPVVREVQS